MIKVFIADDEAPARERLKELLGDIAGEVPTAVAGEARNGLEDRKSTRLKSSHRL